MNFRARVEGAQIGVTRRQPRGAAREANELLDAEVADRRSGAGTATPRRNDPPFGCSELRESHRTKLETLAHSVEKLLQTPREVRRIQPIRVEQMPKFPECNGEYPRVRPTESLHAAAAPGRLARLQAALKKALRRNPADFASPAAPECDDSRTEDAVYRATECRTRANADRTSGAGYR